MTGEYADLRAAAEASVRNAALPHLHVDEDGYCASCGVAPNSSGAFWHRQSCPMSGPAREPDGFPLLAKPSVILALLDDLDTRSEEVDHKSRLGHAAADAWEAKAGRCGGERDGAYQQLAYWWNDTGRCPCGARREAPITQPHVTGCPTARAVHNGGSAGVSS